MIFLLLFILNSLHAEPLSTSSPIECTLRPIDRSQVRPGVAPLNLLDTTSSTNWSGYVAANNLSHPTTGSVSTVTGSWIVPMLHSSTITTYSASWVGIDGFSSGTVEQIGTEQEWVGRSQQNYAWFEMYPSGAYEIVGFPVNVGDLITASVHYQGSNIFQLTIENVTRRVYFNVPTSYTHSSSALRNSAEWIMEAPYYEGVLPLANFGNATFLNCTATINGVTGAITNSHWQNESIEMVTSSRAIKALPTSTYGSGQDFQIAWEHQ